ncbi:hypothetical protein J31TS6_15740 [Brevibacillus reuszeri]|nr:hypothetical protein J31TS6_15740 [Brevibacillus reuszeri]
MLVNTAVELRIIVEQADKMANESYEDCQTKPHYKKKAAKCGLFDFACGASRRIQKENVVDKFKEFLRTERVVAQYGNVR